MKKLLLAVVAAVTLSGCSGTIPVGYQTQSYVKVDGGRAAMGDFTYEPADAGDVDTNQLQNTAVGKIYIAEDVSQYVKRATALEMQNAGVTVEESAPLVVTGKVNKFEMDDLGYSVDWTYSVTYTVTDERSDQPVFQETYTPDKRTTGKFGQPSDYKSSINLIILAGVEEFLKDAKREGVFMEGDDGAKVSVLD
jgi:hypothetical protein